MYVRMYSHVQLISGMSEWLFPSDVPGSFASAKAWLDTLHRLGHVEFTSDCGVCGKLNSAPQSHLSGVQGH